jgi:hypothetical protein
MGSAARSIFFFLPSFATPFRDFGRGGRFGTDVMAGTPGGHTPDLSLHQVKIELGRHEGQHILIRTLVLNNSRTDETENPHCFLNPAANFLISCEEHRG